MACAALCREFLHGQRHGLSDSEKIIFDLACEDCAVTIEDHLRFQKEGYEPSAGDIKILETRIAKLEKRVEQLSFNATLIRNQPGIF